MFKIFKLPSTALRGNSENIFFLIQIIDPSPLHCLWSFSPFHSLDILHNFWLQARVQSFSQGVHSHTNLEFWFWGFSLFSGPEFLCLLPVPIRLDFVFLLLLVLPTPSSSTGVLGQYFLLHNTSLCGFRDMMVSSALSSLLSNLTSLSGNWVFHISVPNLGSTWNDTCYVFFFPLELVWYP